MWVENSKYFYDEVVKRKRNSFTLVNELCLWFQRDVMAMKISNLLLLHTGTKKIVKVLHFLSTTHHSLCTFHILQKQFSQKRKNFTIETKNHSLTNCYVLRDFLLFFMWRSIFLSCHKTRHIYEILSRFRFFKAKM